MTTQGLEYRTIAVYKSAISQVHDPVGQTTLGNLPIVSRFMKGIFRSTPPKPCLCSVWQVVDALNWVSTLEPIETLSLKELTQKLVLLLALTSAARAHELAKLSLDSVSIKTDSWDIIMAAADCASSTTFEQFDHKPSTRGVFASTVLNKLDGDA